MAKKSAPAKKTIVKKGMDAMKMKMMMKKSKKC